MLSASPSNRAKVYGSCCTAGVSAYLSGWFRLGSAAFAEQAIHCRLGHLLRLKLITLPENGILGFLEDTIESAQHDHRKHHQTVLRRSVRSPEPVCDFPDFGFQCVVCLSVHGDVVLRRWTAGGKARRGLGLVAGALGSVALYYPRCGFYTLRSSSARRRIDAMMNPNGGGGFRSAGGAWSAIARGRPGFILACSPSTRKPVRRNSQGPGRRNPGRGTSPCLGSHSGRSEAPAAATRLHNPVSPHLGVSGQVRRPQAPPCSDAVASVRWVSQLPRRAMTRLDVTLHRQPLVLSLQALQL